MGRVHGSAHGPALLMVGPATPSPGGYGTPLAAPPHLRCASSAPTGANQAMRHATGPSAGGFSIPICGQLVTRATPLP
ncbi:hypothetical protein SAMN05428945_0465 [Streptomyces sp. 2224.1]|nr:hypothetical protein SAMN05428945_0465 [Streptomyces sp. 2224.1]